MMKTDRHMGAKGRVWAVAGLVLALGSALTACAPLAVGTAAGATALIVSDRRTSGTQLEDQGIELRTANHLRNELGGRVRISVTSFNRRVLLTGEVPSEADRALALRVVSRVDNVQQIVDELAVMTSPTVSAQAEDSLVTARVKAALLNADGAPPTTAVKVVTERGIAYLMGRVTASEAERATEVVRSTNGVQRVVRVFELISEQELQRLQPAPVSNAAVSEVNSVPVN